MRRFSLYALDLLGDGEPTVSVHRVSDALEPRFQPDRGSLPTLLALLIEEIRFDAESGEVEIAFRPGGPALLAEGDES